MTAIKICGINSAEALDAAREAGADFLGFVFYPPSPRSLTLEDAAYLTNKTPTTMKNVGLFVNPSEADIQTVLEKADLDMIQLHGDESPDDIRRIKGACGLEIIKAVRIGSAADVQNAQKYEKAADWLLFDTLSGKARGGTGECFDWTLLQDYFGLKPWMLSGGLNAGNIGEALSALSPKAVDVSSGVEDSPGVKSPDKIKEFVAAVRQNG